VGCGSGLIYYLFKLIFSVVIDVYLQGSKAGDRNIKNEGIIWVIIE
jgi:hypothetical protein